LSFGFGYETNSAGIGAQQNFHVTVKSQVFNTPNFDLI